jgi:hypothetical protein
VVKGERRKEKRRKTGFTQRRREHREKLKAVVKSKRRKGERHNELPITNS